MIDLLQTGIFGFYLLLVPGLPIGIHLARRAANWRLVLALAPVFSLSINYALLFTLNVVGIRPNLVVFGVLLIIATVALLFKLGMPSLAELKVLVKESSPILPAMVIGAVIWRQAFAGYLFMAPNQDALNHNRWIARIAEVGSALTPDSNIDSPLQKLGSGTGFYPFAWHTTVAIASKVSALAVPAASLISVALFFVVVLPAGLSALAKVWSPQTRHLGAIAGVLVQLYPLVPGAPLSWGSMSSCVGIALLPAGVVASAYMLRDSGRVWTLVAAVTAITLFFVHTPEAATLAVLVLIQFLTMGGARLQKNLPRVVLGLAVFAIPAMWIFRAYIFTDRSSLTALFGAPEPFWAKAIGSFFAMNINVALGFSVLSMLFVVGLVAAAHDSRDRWMAYGVLALFLVYLVSGSGTGFLNHFRVFTAPWYASYERTLWVMVPFAALISAYAIARLLPSNVHTGLFNKVVFGSVAALLLVVVVFQQVGRTVAQIRSGTARSAMIGPNDLGLIEEARALVAQDEIALSFAADGTIYPYIYEGIRVTSGAPLDGDGNPNAGVATIMKELGNLCSSAEARAAFDSEHVAAVFLAKRGVWGAPLWTASEARALDGLDIVRDGDLLILLVPNFAECS